MLITTQYHIIGHLIDELFTRDELRRLAVQVGVPRGKDKYDTITNLCNSGKLDVKITITGITRCPTST
jgi:hypothetical protein